MRDETVAESLAMLAASAVMVAVFLAAVFALIYLSDWLLR